MYLLVCMLHYDLKWDIIERNRNYFGIHLRISRRKLLFGGAVRHSEGKVILLLSLERARQRATQVENSCALNNDNLSCASHILVRCFPLIEPKNKALNKNPNNLIKMF